MLGSRRNHPPCMMCSAIDNWMAHIVCCGSACLSGRPAKKPWQALHKLARCRCPHLPGFGPETRKSVALLSSEITLSTHIASGVCPAPGLKKTSCVETNSFRPRIACHFSSRERAWCLYLLHHVPSCSALPKQLHRGRNSFGLPLVIGDSERMPSKRRTTKVNLLPANP